MPGFMDLSPMRPNELWETDAVDLYLGRAVQDAYREGKETAKQGHDADQKMQQRIGEMTKGRTQC